jgi:hypothetical protein
MNQTHLSARVATWVAALQALCPTAAWGSRDRAGVFLTQIHSQVCLSTTWVAPLRLFPTWPMADTKNHYFVSLSEECEHVWVSGQRSKSNMSNTELVSSSCHLCRFHPCPYQGTIIFLLLLYSEVQKLSSGYITAKEALLYWQGGPSGRAPV